MLSKKDFFVFEQSITTCFCIIEEFGLAAIVVVIVVIVVVDIAVVAAVFKFCFL